MEQIRLDMIPKGILPVCHASQYDVGRVIRFNVVDGLQGYIFTDETAEVHIRKPDNTVVTADVEVTSGKSYVDIITTQQMVAVAGENICELQLNKEDTIIGSLNFRMQVEPDPMDGGIESASEIHDLQSQVSQAVSIEVASQYDSSDVIFDDEATTGHGTGYVVSSEYIKELEDNISESFEGVAEELDGKANTTDLSTVATSGSYDDLSNKPVIDSSLSSSSTNAVQNKIVKSAIDAKANTSDLSTVATSGAYNDLSGRPTIPSCEVSAPTSLMSVGSTWQLPAGFLNHKLITVTARRYGYACGVTISSNAITGGTATEGVFVPRSATDGWLFTISASGLLTYKQSIGGAADPTVEVWGAF